MQALAPSYLLALAGQIGILSAFLGGLAGTLLVLLLQTPREGRSVDWAIGLAAAAAIAFIFAVISTTMLQVALHPNAPPGVASPVALGRARIAGTLAFLLGLYFLLLAIGLSGWTRSPRAGRTTAACAALGLVLVTWAAAGF